MGIYSREEVAECMKTQVASIKALSEKKYAVIIEDLENKQSKLMEKLKKIQDSLAVNSAELDETSHQGSAAGKSLVMIDAAVQCQVARDTLDFYNDLPFLQGQFRKLQYILDSVNKYDAKWVEGLVEENIALKRRPVEAQLSDSDHESSISSGSHPG